MRTAWRVFGVLGAAMALGACESDYTITDLNLVGGDGVLRFNLQFTNEAEVDLDLHVITPGGEEIYYAEPTDATGGELDVDCYCFECPQGPNENVFWSPTSPAASGTYQVSVQYFGPCDFFAFPPPSSEFTLRVLESAVVMETFEGTLADFGQERSFTYVFGQ